MLIIDYRDKANGGQPFNRPLGSITHAAWHYTATLNSFILNHQNYWRNNLGWRMGGYHFYIDRDGNIYQMYNLTVQTNGVGGHNSYTVHISVETDSEANYTEAQLQARAWLTRKLVEECPNLKYETVWGHREFPNQSTACPGHSVATMNQFRQQLGSSEPIKVQEIKDTTNTTSDGKLDINGVFFGNKALIKELQRHFNTPITGNISDIPNPSMLITAMQNFYGSKVTGNVSRPGNKSLLWEAMQKYHGTQVTGQISASGSSLIKKIQQELNAGTYPQRANSSSAPSHETLKIDGSLGPATARRWQQVMNTQVTGVIGGQSRHAITENIAAVQFGSGGSMLIRAVQRELGVKEDGSLGPVTLRAWQRRMGTPVTGAISPSGSAVVMELQRRLNRNTF